MSPAYSVAFSMSKRLLLAVLIVLVGFAGASAQSSLFGAPDTVCARQPIKLTDSINGGVSTYAWSFCSGNLQATPQLRNLGSTYNLRQPSALEVVQDGGRYYAFVLNRGANTLTKLDFGPTLSNLPIVTPLGILNNTVPDTPAGIYLLKDNGSWFLFVAGGSAVGNSSISRFDFGATLANTPNSVNFGNPGGVLNAPRGLFVAPENGNYYGYVLNAGTSTLVRLSFGSNLSFTPSLTDLGNIGSMDRPYDMAPVYNNGSWTFFVTNFLTSTITRIDAGTSLAGVPTGVNEGSLFGKLNGPTGITSIRDCDNLYLFINNSQNNELLRVAMSSSGALPTTVSGVSNFTGLGGEFNRPTGLSNFIRDSASLYAFAVNRIDSSLTRIRFGSCNRASAFLSRDSIPPAFSYDTAGIYTVYLGVDEGLPTMRSGCRQIVVLPIPGINISNDTLICQGDTITLVAQSVSAASQLWTPAYNLSSNSAPVVLAYPAYDIDYRILFDYTNGCQVDTDIFVRVNTNKADAGPDRVIADGATTLLGGPLTTAGPGYTYRWFPANYLDDPSKANPVATPLSSYTYYLAVTYTTNELTCTDVDSVVVLTRCADLNLPNAFLPESRTNGANRFGLLNRQIVKLNYFKIFDRWGGEVFSTTDITKEWDGTRNGEPVQGGVYIWEADGFCNSGQRLKRSGNVTVLR